MNRIIKFRGWHEITREMIIFDDLYVCEEYSHLGFGSKEEKYQGIDRLPCSVSEKLEHFQLMQFTGLLDKNEKEIYEGDIVEIEYFRKGSGCLPDKYEGEVVFKDGSFCVDSYSFCEIFANNKMALEGKKLPIYFEVKGNIYENPELLEPNQSK